MELCLPGPAGGVSQGGCAGAVDVHGGEGDESGAVGGGWRAGERSGPVADVVGEHCACEPCTVRAVVPGGDVFESRAFFEIADGELDAGVAAVAVSCSVLVMNAWCRQSGHSRCCAVSVRRVRRTTRRTVPLSVPRPVA